MIVPAKTADHPKLTDASGLRSSLRAFAPTRHVRTIDWAREHIVNDQGRPYDHSAYPHIGAPGGPMDALDDFRIREIALQWATRLGKSFFGQVAMIKAMKCGPAPAMFVSSTEKLAKEITERTYHMMRQRRPLRELLVRPERFQRQDIIETRGMKMFVAWARSASTLADKNVKFGHANEIDKWEHASTAKEADPLKLFTDRFKDYQAHRKLIFESTPTIRGQSRIENKLKSGTNCRLWVPCPHCKRYQILELGAEDSSYGLKWDRLESGLSDSEHAKQTAHYVCRHCLGRCGDFHRAWMIRRGVWCPAGCTVDDGNALATAHGAPYVWKNWKSAPWIVGSPIRDGAEASYQLSSLCALSLSWGDIAKEFIDCKGRPQLLRNFVNQWMGETWEQRRTRTTAETVAERCGIKLARGIVPSGAYFLTVAIDRQGADGGFVVYVVLAHGLEDRAWLVDYGIADVLESVYDNVIRRPYEHEDGGQPLISIASVTDSGFKTRETYQFCDAHEGVIPCKGSSDDLQGDPYKFVTLGHGRNGKKVRSEANGQLLLHVNTDFWETDLQSRIEDRRAGEPHSLGLCREASNDPQFLEQLLNGTLSDLIDKRGNPKTMWVKKDESTPNDFRDAIRYGLCLGQAIIDDRDGDFPVRAEDTTKRKSIVSPGATRPDGRKWLER